VTATALGLTLALVSGDYAPTQAGSAPLSPELEARVQRVGKELRCAVCQGVAITDSPASMARAQLDMVRQLVREGKSDEEIRAYFVARYDEWVLLDPKTEGTSGLVWFLPVAVAALGALGGAWYVRQNRAGKVAAPAAVPPASPPAGGDAFLDAIRSELDR
jgi:cytochrome c-type biogenesis protein CcmH